MPSRCFAVLLSLLRSALPACGARLLLPWIAFGLGLANLHGATSGDFQYSDSGTAITITSYIGGAAAVAIPATIIGKPVTAIGPSAFQHTGITSVIIPPTVTTIGDYAFWDCQILAGVTIPDSVTSIGNYAFASCWNLVRMTFPKNIAAVGLGAFADCRSLTDAYFQGNAPATFGLSVFDGAGNLYGHFTVYYSTTATGFTSPAWKGYIAAAVVAPTFTTQPASRTIVKGTTTTLSIVTTGTTPLTYQWYQGARGDTSAPVSGATAANFTTPALTDSTSYWVRVSNVIGSADSTTAALTIDLTYSDDGTAITITGYVGSDGAVVIPSIIAGKPVTGIAQNAFLGRSDLTSVTISSGLASIGADAFSGCSSLTSAEFLGNAPTLGTGVFAGTASGFTVAYHEGATGFTSPTWLGYPSVMLSPEIEMEQPAGTGLIDGVSVVDFGAIPRDSWSKRTFTIRNSGTATLTKLAVTVTGANAAEYTVSVLPATTLTAGKDMVFTVTFAPVVLGGRPANLHLASNDADESPFDLSLVGGSTPITFTEIGPSVTCTSCDTAAVGELEIPAIINGKPVTTIGAYAFSSFAGPSVVTIPASVTTIGGYAFYGASNLTSVTIPSSVVSVGPYAFANCAKLKSVSLPSNMTSLWRGAFANCPALTGVTIPPLVADIGDGAFANCTTLKSLEFLGNAPALEGALGSVGSNFTVYFHNESTGFTSPTWMGFHCVNLDTHPEIGVELSDGTVLTDGVSAVYFDWVLIGAATSRTFTIRNSGTDPLTNLALSLTGANAGDFTCSSVAASVAPGASTTFTVTFSTSTTGARTAVLHLASNDADEYPFDTTLGGSLMPLTFTDNGTSITITGHTGTVTGPLNIPAYINGKPVTGIANSAFINCSGLTSLTLPPDLTLLGDSAFRGCSGLSGTLTIPTGVTSIGYSVFRGCSGLTGLTFHPDITSIGSHAFALCSGLRSIIIPPSVASIGSFAFAWCYALESAAFSPGLITIDDSAFSVCRKLGNVTIPSTVTTIAPFAFSGCDAMETITVDPANPSYCDLDGLLFNKAKTTLVFCPAKRIGAYIVPPGVTTIATVAFEGCRSLIWVTFPASITSIEQRAFAYCSALTRAEFLGSAPAMGTNVFTAAASGFTVLAHWGATGFTTPTWMSYPCVVFTPYLTWNFAEFSEAERASNQTTMETDFDSDGSTNLLEYAFGGNPKVADATSIAPKAALVANMLQISFICDAACEDITYTVQSSSTLAADSWTDIAQSVGGVTTVPLGALSTVADSGSGLRTVTVSDATTVNTGPRRFLRVKVTSP